MGSAEGRRQPTEARRIVRRESTIFGDPLAATIPDPEHSAHEQRSVTIGPSASGRVVVVVHADRGEDIRIISARPATAGAKKKYAKAQRKGR